MTRRLDDILQQLGTLPATPSHWALVCRALDAVDDRTLAGGLVALRARLARWPAEVRTATPRWTASLFGHRPDFRLRLVGALWLGAEGVFAADGLDAFLRHLEGLSVERLELGHLALGAAMARRVVEHGALRSVRSLGLAGTFSEGVEVVRAVACAPALEGLERLDLSYDDLTDAGANALASSRTLTRLQSLTVRNVNPDRFITAEGVRAIAASPCLHALRRLDLCGHRVGPSGLAALGRSRHLRGLREVDLFANGLDASHPELPIQLAALPALERPEQVVCGAWPAVPDRTSARLAELRELLYGTPRAVTWHALCELFNDWPDAEDLGLGLDYAAKHLERWPDEVRRAPWHWNQTLLSERPDPRLRLCRHVELEPQRMLVERRFEQLEATWSLFGLTGLTLVGFDVDVERSCLQQLRLPGVRHLALPRHFHAGLSVVRAALGSPCFGALSSLDLRFSEAGPALIDELRHAPTAGTLESLALDGSNVGSAVVGLATRGELSGLTTLGLEGLRLGSDVLTRLLGAPGLQRLRSLRLSHNGFPEEVAGQLLRQDLLPALQRLELRDASLTPAALESLCASPAFRHLDALDVGANRLGAEGLRAIVEAAPPTLVHLGLTGTELDARDLRELRRLPHLLELESLELGQNPLRADAAIELAQVPWARLEVLKLDRAALDDRAALALAHSPHLRNLVELELGRNRITDHGATALLRSPHLMHIRWLNLVHCALAHPHLERLPDIRPLRYGLEPRFAPPDGVG